MESEKTDINKLVTDCYGPSPEEALQAPPYGKEAYEFIRKKNKDVNQMIIEEKIKAQKALNLNHMSDCVLNSEPAEPSKLCDCGAVEKHFLKELTSIAFSYDLSLKDETKFTGLLNAGLLNYQGD